MHKGSLHEVYNIGAFDEEWTVLSDAEDIAKMVHEDVREQIDCTKLQVLGWRRTVT